MLPWNVFERPMLKGLRRKCNYRVHQFLNEHILIWDSQTTLRTLSSSHFCNFITATIILLTFGKNSFSCNTSVTSLSMSALDTLIQGSEQCSCNKLACTLFPVIIIFKICLVINYCKFLTVRLVIIEYVFCEFG